MKNTNTENKKTGNKSVKNRQQENKFFAYSLVNLFPCFLVALRTCFLVALRTCFLVSLFPCFLFPAFKDVGWGSRPAGMGGAFVAISDDANAPLYNPAGICQIDKTEATFMYAKPYWGLENVNWGLMYLSSVWRTTERAYLGVSLTDFNASGLYHENTIALSCAANFFSGDILLAGVNIKYLTHRYNWDARAEKRAEEIKDPVITSGDSAGDVSFDVGVLGRITDRLSLGLSGKNLNQPDVGIKYEDKVPMEGRIGISYKIPYWKSMDNIVSAIDYSYRAQEWGKASDKWNIHAGIETWFKEHTYGLRSGYQKNEVSFGGSFNKAISKNFSFQIDYACGWSLSITENIGTHRVSTTVRF